MKFHVQNKCGRKSRKEDDQVPNRLDTSGTARGWEIFPPPMTEGEPPSPCAAELKTSELRKKYLYFCRQRRLDYQLFYICMLGSEQLAQVRRHLQICRRLCRILKGFGPFIISRLECDQLIINVHTMNIRTCSCAVMESKKEQRFCFSCGVEVGVREI